MPALGDEVIVVVDVSVALDVVELPPAGEGFTIVVLVSVLVPGDALAAGTTVSVRCSQAARSAALARMQRDFFIVIWDGRFWVTD